MQRQRIYLDHAATSPMPQPVIEAYTAALAAHGNPASTHADGQDASVILETARQEIAQVLGCEAVEVVFTSGGTESINLALKGTFWARQQLHARPLILVAEGEHHATVDAVEWLERTQGAEVVWLPIDADGVLQPSTLERALAGHDGDRVALVTFLWANNEVGSVQPVAELCAVAARFEIPVHVDAVAALGQAPIDFAASGAAMVSLSAHKIGGPVGVGALLLARQHTLESLLHGGSQQRGRSGTQDVSGAVGFAAALTKIANDDGYISRLSELRDSLIAGVEHLVSDAQLRGADPRAGGVRLPGNAHFTFPGCQGDSLLYLLDAAGISVSVGSACQAGVQEISHVLLAMGLDERTAVGSLRMTLGASTSPADIDAFLSALPAAVESARRAGISSVA